jgi:hypothetical protein
MPSILLTTRNVGVSTLRSQREDVVVQRGAPSRPSTMNRIRSASSAAARDWRAVRTGQPFFHAGDAAGIDQHEGPPSGRAADAVVAIARDARFVMDEGVARARQRIEER